MNKFTGEISYRYNPKTSRNQLVLTYKEAEVTADVPMHIWENPNEKYIAALVRNMQSSLIRKCMDLGYDTESQSAGEPHVDEGGSGVETLAPTDPNLSDSKEAT